MLEIGEKPFETVSVVAQYTRFRRDYGAELNKTYDITQTGDDESK